MAATTEGKFASDIAFTPSVKAIQSRKGSRRAYSQMESKGGWATRITPDLADFISRQSSVFLATASADGQPYIQHRGGPPGFLHVLDEATIGFADLAGNRQYITAGNLQDNSKACLFLIDYENQQRIKIWGTARIVEGNSSLVETLMPSQSVARAEHAILFTVAAWDVNCPKHIPQRFEAADVKQAIEERDRRITELEAEIARLQLHGSAHRGAR